MKALKGVLIAFRGSSLFVYIIFMFLIVLIHPKYSIKEFSNL